MRWALNPAPKPLSILTTETPLAQEFIMASNVVTPRKLAPYPTLVGTALDNAIESCAAEQDPEKRLIRTAVYAQNGFVLFRVSCRTEHAKQV